MTSKRRAPGTVARYEAVLDDLDTQVLFEDVGMRRVAGAEEANDEAQG